MKKNWGRKIIGGLCLGSAAFVFQACYGVPKDFGHDLCVEGLVKSKKTGLPINGIKVSVADQVQYTMTDKEGKFEFYIPKSSNILVKFEDVDSIRTTLYSSRDSLLPPIRMNQEYLRLELELEEKDEDKQAD
ncbi:carboxypeptidase-like regulatory domain-containing protein [Bacteroides sp. 224]|uniref:carboxypeptidase-like regulatory domain-containing protein n=1 Tax=Bacteroides sp. 224 TaxID=2302936 RepID=UPI0013D0BDFD|nr:carboxypeptidase-like regulatory domain-containing protein [Bacteroides sp. 224]NDV64167.1 hypothetical protein [Bacteroides sp. 224]